ncbi:hypothetical protein J3R82DRAFT_1478 [Butyriboletus roseoflavus]|nr:hypothetical protein J3R82DRAFT_1478 [Butyriboletus roseoflavus]
MAYKGANILQRSTMHRDISEKNIVLGLRPGDERGYLIDLDISILPKAKEHTLDIPRDTFLRRCTEVFRSCSTEHQDT